MKHVLIFSLSLFFLFIALKSNSQTTQPAQPATLGGSQVRDGIYDKEHVPARILVPYYHLREADVMWSKKIWRELDLTEKINHPLYFPSKKMEAVDDRFSLIALLMYGVKYENLEVYGTITDEFKSPLTWKEIESNFGVKTDTNQVEDALTGELQAKVVVTEMKPEEVKRYLMKEVWYLDKQRAKMEVRILGLCPVREYVREEAAAAPGADAGGGEDEASIEKKLICWVYYPSVRNLFANHEVFNPYNDAERRTFEDIFFKRRFSSWIYQETNVYDNRQISDYQVGLDARLESEKVKTFMFTLEHDLWEW